MYVNPDKMLKTQRRMRSQLLELIHQFDVLDHLIHHHLHYSHATPGSAANHLISVKDARHKSIIEKPAMVSQRCEGQECISARQGRMAIAAEEISGRLPQ